MKESFFARLRKVLDTEETAWRNDFDVGKHVPIEKVLTITHIWVQAAHTQSTLQALEVWVANQARESFSTLLFSPVVWNGEVAKVRAGCWSGEISLHHEDHIASTLLLGSASPGCKFSLSIAGYLIPAAECGHGLRIRA